MDLDSVLARYFANEQVGSWLLCSEPVKEVTADALRRAFVYAIGWGINARGSGPHEMNIEDMYVMQLVNTSLSHVALSYC